MAKPPTKSGPRSALPPPVAQAVKEAGIPVSALGIVVQEVGSKKNRLALQAKQGFNPASTMKLLTSSAALHVLGANYHWTTRVYGVGQLKGDEWHGDLIIQGGLDPKLVLEDFWLLLRQLRAKGIRQIRGNVWLERSAYPALDGQSGNFDGGSLKPYNVLPDALLLNFKSLRLHFLPQGNLVQVRTDPLLANVRIDPLPISNTNPSCEDWQDGLGLSMRPDGAGMHLQFSGSYPASCAAHTWDVQPYAMSADAYFAAMLRAIWQELGGTLQGKIAAGNLPAQAELLVEWQSPSLTEVVRDVNKFSNNVMARHLLLSLGWQAGQPASVEQGILQVRQYLSGLGISASELVIENGSGLSRLERISPETLAQILQASWRSALMPEFVASLPLVGVDGTMRKRLKDSAALGQAHIKTGYLHDVRAVAGYVHAKSGKRYVVVGFINHPRSQAGRAILDSLIEWTFTNG